MSIRVISSDLDNPVRGDIPLLQNQAHLLMLFDHLLGILKVAELEVFEMVLGVDDREDVTLE